MYKNLLMVDPFLSIKEVLNFMRMIYGEKPKKNSVTKDSHYYARERNYFEYTNLGLYNACCIATTFKP